MQVVLVSASRLAPHLSGLALFVGLLVGEALLGDLHNLEEVAFELRARARGATLLDPLDDVPHHYQRLRCVRRRTDRQWLAAARAVEHALRDARDVRAHLFLGVVAVAVVLVDHALKVDEEPLARPMLRHAAARQQEGREISVSGGFARTVRMPAESRDGRRGVLVAWHEGNAGPACERAAARYARAELAACLATPAWPRPGSPKFVQDVASTGIGLWTAVEGELEGAPSFHHPL